VFGIRWGVLKQSYNRAVAQRMQGIDINSAVFFDTPSSTKHNRKQNIVPYYPLENIDEIHASHTHL
jgi:hypothetical protein